MPLPKPSSPEQNGASVFRCQSLGRALRMVVIVPLSVCLHYASSASGEPPPPQPLIVPLFQPQPSCRGAKELGCTQSTASSPESKETVPARKPSGGGIDFADQRNTLVGRDIGAAQGGSALQETQRVLVADDELAQKSEIGASSSASPPNTSEAPEKRQSNVCNSADCYCRRKLASKQTHRQTDRQTVLLEPDPKVEGSLTKEEIEAVIRANLAQIRACYERNLQGNPDLQGRVLSAFVIGTDGRVSTSKVEQSTLGSQGTEECIRMAILRWKFPLPRGGGLVNVRTQFHLSLDNHFSSGNVRRAQKEMKQCVSDWKKSEKSRIAEQKRCEETVAAMASHRLQVPKSEFQSTYASGVMCGIVGSGCGLSLHRYFLRFTERYATLSTLTKDESTQGDISYYRVRSVNEGFRLKRVCYFALSEEVATSLSSTKEMPREQWGKHLVFGHFDLEDFGVVVLKAANEGPDRTYQWDVFHQKDGERNPYRINFYPMKEHSSGL